MALLKTVTKDSLVFHVFDTRAEGGALAAREGADVIRDLLSKQDKVNIIFAAAPSQNDTLSALLAEEGIDWSRVRAFHMDEYVGFGRECPQSFGTYLYDHVFGKLPFGEVYYINGAAEDPEEECRRYSELLTTYPTDIVFLGIGENAHIAFNDPPVANFKDTAKVKAVKLDEVCRQQQVNDGCFKTLDEVIAESDFISLHCPLTDSTNGLVNMEFLKKMKKTAILINTSRGPVINEADLKKALDEGIIAAAGVDVLSAEPAREDNPLLTCENCIITPHIAWASFEARSRLMSIFKSNVEAFVADKPINVVN